MTTRTRSEARKGSINLSPLKSIRDSRIVGELDSADFIELPAFQRHREDYLNDEAFRVFQQELLKNPATGDVIEGTGGLRKVRVLDKGRGKGKRSGIRVIYFWAQSLSQFWLFTLYDKDELSDLSGEQKKALKKLLAEALKRVGLEKAETTGGKNA